MFVVDTNILIYAAVSEYAEHALCRRRLEEWRRERGAWYLTWGICYEFLRVVSHPRVFRRPWPAVEAWTFLKEVMASPGLALLVPTSRHAELLEETIREVPHLAGNLVHDATTAALMREHGVRRIYTRDTDFHRFAFLEPVDPLRP